MAKETGKSGQGGPLTKQHKRIAMGEAITGMKKGGFVKGKPTDKPIAPKAKEPAKITVKKKGK